MSTRMKKSSKRTVDGRKRDAAIVALSKLERHFGAEIFKRAMSRKLDIDRAKAKRERLIRQMEKELDQLKKGKLIA